jgi:hypothetical protein
MAKYVILKLKSDCLEIMGVYEASTGQAAVNKMASRGNLSGREWDMRYYAVPHKTLLLSYKPKVK